MAKAGHNVVDSAQLKTIVERVERLNEEKAALLSDIREVYAEAKGNGYDAGTIRKIVKLRELDPQDRMTAQQMVETYMRALGMDLV